MGKKNIAKGIRKKKRERAKTLRENLPEIRQDEPVRPVTAEKKPGLFRRTVSFFKSMTAELRRVSWLTPEQLNRNVGAVFVFAAGFTVFTGAADTALGGLTAFILGV